MKEIITQGEIDIGVQYALFMVDEEAYCLWSRDDIQKSNISFLEKIKPEYFIYQANTHLNKLRFKKHEQFSALAIRVAFSHGLETLFSLLCAAIQSPHCVNGWLSHCRNKQLYDLVKKISNREKITSMFYGKLTWNTLSLTIHESLVLQDKNKEKTIKNGFGELWAKWASLFTDDGFIHEYNSIKHGLRVKPGGFSLAIGSDTAKEKQLIGKSDYGTIFSVPNPLDSKLSKNNFHFVENWRNWNPEDMAWGLHLISMSIENIVSALKIANGFSARKVRFHWPSNIESFTEPWKRGSKLGITSFKHNSMFPKEYLKHFTKSQIKALYDENKILGEKRFVFKRIK